MLFNQHHLTGIINGSITLAFRKWKKPSVKEGSLIKTPIGQVKIISVNPTSALEITSSEAGKAGFASLDELLKLLATIPTGTIYKIKLAYHSSDPRIALRSQTTITNDEFEILKAKLDRLDTYSKEGSWTRDTLMAIQKHPRLKAAELAKLLSKEKDWLKINIRKLKNLGLTISHDPGYEIAPLGKAFLKKYR
jgi:hypothetical protein